ncbi:MULTISPECIES: hypothetical protein [unclassified Methylobacterium]|uniref:hypothetical protein n=1 Tax=unclassified Methylobacterium TaxID=2615210 RepID=UPI00226A461E|nr:MULTISPECIES: hypothetical protein [unclassified Methylobacterium]
MPVIDSGAKREPISQNNGTTAQWWAAHPTLLALCLCLFGLAIVTAAWGIGLLSTSTAQVIGFLYVACLYAFLMHHFGINKFIASTKSVWSLLAAIWFCVTVIYGLFNS